MVFFTKQNTEYQYVFSTFDMFKCAINKQKA